MLSAHKVKPLSFEHDHIVVAALKPTQGFRAVAGFVANLPIVLLLKHAAEVATYRRIIVRN